MATINLDAESVYFRSKIANACGNGDFVNEAELLRKIECFKDESKVFK